MLYILTVHYKEKKWIDIQYQYLKKHIKVPFKLWISAFEIDDDFVHADKVFRDVDSSHANQLDFLAREVLKVANNNDYILFLDSDAFPVRDINSMMQIMRGKELCAIQRLENNGDPQPHPCFCVTTVEFWKEIRGSWQYGNKTWIGDNGVKRTDVGGELYFKLNDNNVEWTKMHRTNDHIYHNVWFGLYDNLIYHHGAGSRDFRCVTDFDEMPFLWKTMRKSGLFDISKQDFFSKKMSQKYNRLLKDKSKKLSLISDEIFSDLSDNIDFIVKLNNREY